MKALTGNGPILLLSVTVSFGCADDHAATMTSATGTVETTESDQTTGVDTTTGMDPLAPWYGSWYTLYPQISINEPTAWGSGGDSLGFKLFVLRAGSATIQAENCLLGPSSFEYTTIVGEGGVLTLEPVGGIHEYTPHGDIERLYIDPNMDCDLLVVRELGTDGVERELFSSSGGPLARGKLCLEYCAEAEGEQGLISDCGTPVPWQCDA